jgi:hypothetical protein
MRKRRVLVKVLGNSVPAAAGKQKGQAFVMMTRCIGSVDGGLINALSKTGIMIQVVEMIVPLEVCKGLGNSWRQTWNSSIPRGMLASEGAKLVFNLTSIDESVGSKQEFVAW